MPSLARTPTRCCEHSTFWRDIAQERDGQGKARQKGQREVCLPPLVETDEAIVVHVDLFKKSREPPLGHGKPCLLERQAQLLLT